VRQEEHPLEWRTRPTIEHLLAQQGAAVGWMVFSLDTPSTSSFSPPLPPRKNIPLPVTTFPWIEVATLY